MGRPVISPHMISADPQTPDPGEASRSGRAALPDPRPRPDPAPGHGHSAGHHMFLHGDYDLKIIARQDYYTGPGTPVEL